MFYIVLSILMILAAIGCFIAYKAMKKKAPTVSGRGITSQGVMRIANTFLLVSVAIIIAEIIFTLLASINQIPAGKVGIIYRFGKIIDQIPEGLQFTPPWTTVTKANTQTTSYKFSKLSCFSQETQEVFVDATLNTNVSPKDIQNLYRTVGETFFAVLVSPRVLQTFKDETVKYKSVDIAPNRETIRRTVKERLSKELAAYSINVTDLLLDNIDFLPGFKASIEKKQQATQKALEEEQNIKARKFIADQAIEDARGKAESVLINANKQAAANLALSKSLTPELIQYTMVSKLSDKIEVMILPAGQNFILSPDMMKKSSSPAPEKKQIFDQ